MDRDTLVWRFRAFAEREAGASPLYQALSARIAEDDALLALAGEARDQQPPANMLFAGVQFLLLGNHGNDPLAAFYPGLSERPQPPEQAFGPFRTFCLAHREALAGLLRTRAVNTNEPARAALLRPAFAQALHELEGPVHFIEVGASAGLVLLWPHVAMDYGAGRVVGPQDAPLTLPCRLRGDTPLDIDPARIASLQGIERERLDVRDSDDATWLRALIWPEQTERAARLEQAIALAQRHPPTVHHGDALELLPELIRDLPPDEALIVHHQFTLNQFPEAARTAFEHLLADTATERPLRQVSLEWSGRERAALLEIAAPPAAPQRLARCDPHGAWLVWEG